MAVIQWIDEVYSVGLRKMDEQHKQLVGLINALHAHRQSKDREFTDRILATLVNYTQKHFVDEEKILRKLRYPKLEAHHQQHVHFIRTLSEIKKSYDQTGPTPDLIDKLTKFLGDWLTHHILVEDKAYCHFLED